VSERLVRNLLLLLNSQGLRLRVQVDSVASVLMADVARWAAVSQVLLTRAQLASRSRRGISSKMLTRTGMGRSEMVVVWGSCGNNSSSSSSSTKLALQAHTVKLK
jgi:hypothetical protein